jgi:hypothetical protein
MLWTIFVILLVLWLFGLVSSYTLGGYIHREHAHRTWGRWAGHGQAKPPFL